MQDYQLYKIRIKHDTGVINVRVYAHSEQHAKQRVMSVESCPDRAILKVELCPFKVTSNLSKRHFTIYKDGSKYRTERMSPEEFLDAEYWQPSDWGLYLKTSQSYTKI